MKDLQKIKDEYAVELGFTDFEEMFYTEAYEIGEMGIEEIAKRYAQEVAQQALNNAAEKVQLVLSEYRTNPKTGVVGWMMVPFKNNLFIINDGANIVASKESITDPKNIQL